MGIEPYYKNDLTTIYNGDCLEVMEELKEKVQLIITSPPYNNSTKRKGGWGDLKGKYDLYQEKYTEKEYIVFLTNIFNKYNKILNDDGVVLLNISYGVENPSLPYKVINNIIVKTDFEILDTIMWIKTTTMPYPALANRLQRTWEFIFVFYKKDYLKQIKLNKKILKISKKGQKYFEIIPNLIKAKNNDGKNKLNEATFSSELVHKLLDIYYKGGIVLDNFSGTGTTSYACEQRNIKNIGIELSDKQCEYTKERLQNLQMRFDI